MMRGGNRGMRRMIDRMGFEMDELGNVQEVSIKTDKKEILIEKPAVSVMKGKDATVFTVTADDYSERELEVPIFSDDDIDLICDQTGVDKDRARSALAEADGDLARAIMALGG